MGLVDGAAVGDGRCRERATVDLHVGLAQQVLLPDDGARILIERREVAVEQHADPRRAGPGRQCLHLADAEPGHGDVVARYEVGAGLEDRSHVIPAEGELAAHLGREQDGGQHADHDIGEEDRQVGAAPHFGPPSRTPTTLSNELGTVNGLLPVVGNGGLHGTAEQPPTPTVIRVA